MGLPDVALSQLKFIIGMPMAETVSEVSDLGSQNQLKARLFGTYGRRLSELDTKDKLQRLRSITEFYSSADG